MIEKIFILHHTHVDMGYTGDRKSVCDLLVDMVEQVIELVQSSADRPEAERFRWIHEVAWPVMEYVSRGGSRQDELFEQIRNGDVELSAFYMNPSDLFDRDTLETSIDLVGELAREHGLPLTTGMFCDRPGIAWSTPDVLAARGIRHLSTAPNSIMSFPLEVERPFYWEGPDGGRVLVWFTEWRKYWYAEGYMGLKLHEDPAEASRRLLEYIRLIEGEGYRWKGLAFHVAMDNVPPLPQLMDFVAHFNGSQPEVKAALATNRDFFEFMEAQHGADFAVHRCAWPDWWAHEAASTAYETACSRRAKVVLRRVKALGGMLDCAPDPKRLNEAVMKLLLFDEHTFGPLSSVSAPWSLVSRLDWCKKRAYVMGALLELRQIEADLCKGLDEQGDIAVVNPFETDWTGIVQLGGISKGAGRPCLKDVSSGEKIAGQRCGDAFAYSKEGAAYVVSVPAGGVRRFKRSRFAARAQAPGEALANEHFRIEYDSATGAVTQVFDSATDRQLCDPDAEFSFAELIHEHVRRGGRKALYEFTLDPTDPAQKCPTPDFVRQAAHASKGRATVARGPVFDSLTTAGRLPGVKYVRELRLYHAMKRIDVVLQLDKAVVTDYESLYVAFPFGGRAPEVWIEKGGAVYRPGIDQLPGSATDWLSVDEYAAVSSEQGTAILAPHDTPVIQTGELRVGQWAKRLTVDNGRLYSCVMNNMWYTNFPAYQEGMVELHWSLTVHEGAFSREEAERFARGARVGAVVVDPAAGRHMLAQ